jgi:hypothetical protein
MSLLCDVLPDRSKARQERSRAFEVRKTTHALEEVPLGDAALAFSRRRMAVFGTVVDRGAAFDEDVLDVDRLGDLGLFRRIAAQRVGHDLARCVGISSKHAQKKPLGYGHVGTSLQHDIELDAGLFDSSPHQIRLTAQRHEHLGEVPGGAQRATRSLDATREARAELVTAPDRFVRSQSPDRCSITQPYRTDIL